MLRKGLILAGSVAVFVGILLLAASGGFGKFLGVGLIFGGIVVFLIGVRRWWVCILKTFCAFTGTFVTPPPDLPTERQCERENRSFLLLQFSIFWEKVVFRVYHWLDNVIQYSFNWSTREHSCYYNMIPASKRSGKLVWWTYLNGNFNAWPLNLSAWPSSLS